MFNKMTLKKLIPNNNEPCIFCVTLYVCETHVTCTTRNKSFITRSFEWLNNSKGDFNGQTFCVDA